MCAMSVHTLVAIWFFNHLINQMPADLCKLTWVVTECSTYHSCLTVIQTQSIITHQISFYITGHSFMLEDMKT